MDYDRALELFEPVLGFEVHVELNTRTKMFSDAPNPALSSLPPECTDRPPRLTHGPSASTSSDYVFILHRPYLLKFVGSTYGPDKLDTDIAAVYIHIIKQREGIPVILKMTADFKNMAIKE